MAGKTRQQQKDDTAQRIFETAMDLFRANGYEATTIEAITAAAGVAKGTFFVHFPSKQAVVAHFGAMQMARLSQALAADTVLLQLPFREQIQRIFTALGARLADQREIVRLVAVELFRSQNALQEETSNISGLDSVLFPLVEDAQVRGELRSDYSAEVLAGMIRNVYLMAVLEWLGQEQYTFADLANRSFRLVVEGLEP